MPGAAAMNPYMQGAQLGTGLLGVGLNAYGTYEQNKQAQKQYEMAVRQWEAEQERQRRREEADRQQQILNNVMAGGTYAQGAVKNAQSAYGSYAQQTGL